MLHWYVELEVPTIGTYIYAVQTAAVINKVILYETIKSSSYYVHDLTYLFISIN